MKKIFLLVLCFCSMLGINAASSYDKSIALVGEDNYIIKDDNTLWYFKSEKDYHNQSEPVEVTEPVKIMDNVKSVDRDCVLKQDNTLWQWKENAEDGTKELIYISDNVKSMSSSIGFTLFIKQDNSLWGYGISVNGELGLQDTEYTEKPVKIMNNVKKAVAGFSHTIILKTDGSVWTLGDNGYGALGTEDIECSHVPIYVMENVKDIYGGISASFAITEDDTLWRWGTNFGDGIGIGKDKMFQKPIKYMDNVKSVVSRWGYNIILKTDGSVWMYGESEVSDSSYTEGGELNLPEKLMDNVNSITDWRTATWLQAVLALKNDGSLYVIDLYKPQEERYFISEAKKVMDDVRLLKYESREEKQTFSDISECSEISKKAINSLRKAGIITGTSESEFSPDKAITRAEIAALLLRIQNLPINKMGSSFLDVKETDWYFDIAGASKKYNIVYGYEDNTFRADEPITKEQLLVLATRVLKNEGKENSEITDILYSDKDKLSEWAKKDIEIALASGLVENTDFEFNPQSTVSRADSAVILYSLYNLI